ncbi:MULTISPECIES: prepilin-type N-terminal cleavage/methylation domain-containing protein [unclassified Thiocapsa]|uniref:prepilin-type N-terminal cleavage/methylation domain-containing protein n=1 Tax=unclassified Thiocapsa TaxID=2641286 RepID=UPI0035B08D0B
MLRRTAQPLRPPARTSRRQAGVTLTELLVGTTVGALVLIGISSTYLLGARATTQNVQQARLQQELRAVLELMQQDIRRAGYWAFPSGAASNAADNPFQRTIAGFNTDLRTGAVSGETTASCLLYSYDMDDNGKVGCGICSPEGEALLDGSNVEMFGFRLRNGAIELRIRKDGSDDTFDCASGSGRWERLTDDRNVRITTLSFDIPTTTLNLNPSKDSADPCSTGDICRTSRSVDITLIGELKNSPDVQLRLDGTAAVRNDRYFHQD